MTRLRARRWIALLAAVTFSALGALFASSALADHVTPGEAGLTKVNIHDNTNNGSDAWNVATPDPGTGGPDPVIGFVNFRPTVPGDPTNIIVVVALKDGAPSCDYNIELVVDDGSTDGGLPPDGFPPIGHHGVINVIGTMDTNAQGNGNSGAIAVDVTTLINVSAPGSFTYAHVDVEDYDADCTEADGTGVVADEYGASGFDPTVGPPPDQANIHWLQP